VAYLVDTNILVYRFDPRFPDKQGVARDLLRKALIDDAARIPHQALLEFVAKRGLEPELAFPEEPKAEFQTEASAPIYQKFFLAVEGTEVRGGYFLTYETWRINQTTETVCNYRLPISESLINCAYRGLGRTLVQHATKRNPFLYCLGMTNMRRPLPKMLRAENWWMKKTPFYFRFRPALEGTARVNLPAKQKNMANRDGRG